MEEKKLNVLCLTLTCGRLNCLKRALALFLAQDYPYEHTMLIFNNSAVPQVLHLPDDVPGNKHITLVNSPRNSKTGADYTSLGDIHNDALNFIPEDIDVVVHTDDDDLFLEDHISEGVKGYKRCGKLAYKPKFSWYKHSKGVELMENTMEPSIFINAQFLKETGYDGSKNVSQHLLWVHELLRRQEICSDPEGKPTLLYTWGIDPVYKTSGTGENPSNFGNYRAYSRDFGDGIVSPAHKLTYIDLLMVPEIVT